MPPAPSNPHAPPEPRAIHALMSGLIDYAGLFPPAKLPMDKAVANYAKYLASPEAWMLGRFILPVSRIEEFRKAAAAHLPTRGDNGHRGAAESDDEEWGGWPISAIADGDLDENLDSIFAFNSQHAEARNGLAMIDAIEIRVPPESETDPTPSARFIDDALGIMAEGVYPFFELPVTAPDLRGCIAALAGEDAGAKVRTGGITLDAIPPACAVAEFLVACHAAEVPFKATAGLHHAVRAEHPLTYEPQCPRTVMHGFLNVFIAAAMVQAFRIDARDAAKILEETDARKFLFDDAAISWGPGRLDLDQIQRGRDTFALSYGSCSFDEPVAELRSLGLI